MLNDLTPAQLELQERARLFVEEQLIPHEELAERSGGRIPEEISTAIRDRALRDGLSGGLHSRENGGQGWSRIEWYLVQEQLGRSTNALSWHTPGAYNVLASGTPEQIQRHLRPALRGEQARAAYAVTERDAGSDPSRITTTARRRAEGGFVIDGEKWFVTHGDVAPLYIVMAHLVEPDGERRPTLFLIDRQAPGVHIVDDPPFSHTYPDGHPTVRFESVAVGEDSVLGPIGGAEELQRAWFVEERIGIAARGLGAMWRLLEESVDWASERMQGGRAIIDYQGISFPLADSAADAAAGRALTLDVCRLVDAGADPKLVHAKAAMAKLFVSEAAWRCADRAVQVFGGRGYMRTNVAERFLRELRVDRIWEGTSEIQRLIIAGQLAKRGVSALV